MKAITAKSPHDSSFSFSRRYFHWKKKLEDEEDEDDDNDEEILTFSSSSHAYVKELKSNNELNPSVAVPSSVPMVKAPRRKLPQLAASKLRSALAVFSSKRRSHSSQTGSSGLGTRVVGTLFGYRRGHVHLAFQVDPKSGPAFMVELATPTSVLVREMASGLVRIAMECEKKAEKRSVCRLLEEPIWRTFCNGKKCGYAVRRECGPEEWKVLEAVGPVTMGAGVLPAKEEDEAGGSEGELMYMRAKFERVVGSKDSEAFYMMNPDGHGGPELCIYLLRV